MTPKEIMEALLAGEKLQGFNWSADAFVCLGPSGDIVDEHGFAGEYDIFSDVWHIYESKLTDEELIAEWEERAFAYGNAEGNDSVGFQVYTECARQLKERKL